MVGYSTHHEVAVWVRMTRPTTVRLRYWPVDKPDSRTLTPPQRPRATTDKLRMCTFEIWSQVFGMVGCWLAIPICCRRSTILFGFRLKFFGSDGLTPSAVVAFGSCAYTNDPEYEAPKKKPYGGGYEIYETIRKAKPDMMLWLGDNIYLRPEIGLLEVAFLAL